MRRFRYIYILILSFSFLGSTISHAKQEWKSAIIILDNPVKSVGLYKRQAKQFALRQSRHAFVVQSLQETAQKSQEDLLDFLEEQKKDQVKEFNSFWIINAITVTAIDSILDVIRKRDDVVQVYLENEIDIHEPIKPVYLSKASKYSSGCEPGLKAIKADSLWAKGVTGAGSLVGNIDTGVDGMHEALYMRWRGNCGGGVQASWFGQNDFPIDQDGHGTYTMGIITGMTNGDTVGAAFGAQWIAPPHGNSIETFQWLADPDGYPMTIDDVPDVVNYSMGGLYQKCSDRFWALIDALEAAGSVFICSAGNNGKEGPFTIINPANRVTTPLNTFSVGAIDGNNVIAEWSSRGPSVCDSISIKPEVVAPGVYVRSLLDRGYAYFSGTSCSAPYVSGAVALLRQVNPDASVDDIKYALLNSATDLGEPGEDNDYGMGLINVNRAAKLLPPNVRPSINAYKYTINNEDTYYISSDEQNELIIFMVNTGLDASDINVKLNSDHPRCHIQNPTIRFNDIKQNEKVDNKDNPFRFELSDNIADGETILFTIQITADNGYMHKNTILLIKNKQDPIKDISPSKLEYTLSKGEKRLSELLLTNPGSAELIYEIDEDTLTSGDNKQYNISFTNDSLQTFQTIVIDSTGELPAEASFDILKINFAIYDTLINYVIFKDTLETHVNRNEPCLFLQVIFSSNSIPNWLIFIDSDQNLKTGQYPLKTSRSFTDQTSLLALGTEYRISTDLDQGLGRIRYTNPDYSGYYIEIPIRRNNDKITFVIPVTSIDQDSSMNIGVIGFINKPHYQDSVWIGSETYLDVVPNVGYGQIGTNPSPVPWLVVFPQKGTLSPSGSQIKLHTLIDATHLNDGEYTTSIIVKSNDPIHPEMRIPVILHVKDNLNVAREYCLSQNYPNPFNHNTIIEYDVKEHMDSPDFMKDVTIKIYNILGQHVRTLVNKPQHGGKYLTSWNGKNSKGHSVSSGVYFYQLKIGEFVETKKMLLLR